MKIYTKTGDSGTTGLFAGPRVPKDHPRIQAYGTIDELNALLGVVDARLRIESQSELADAASMGLQEWILFTRRLLAEIQHDLFSIGAQLATPSPEAHGMCLLTSERVQALEQAIDHIDSQLPALSCFILPGGSSDSAFLHLARTVCRRAERDVVSLAHDSSAQSCEIPIVYLNRLSDLLFLMARQANSQLGLEDISWVRPTRP